MTCPSTTTKSMLRCSGSLMPFAPRVSVIVCLSDYTCTLTSTSCGKDLDHVRANPSIPQVGKFSAGNDMVPQAVPPPLQNLRLLEKQLIAMAHPIARVVRLKGGAQYGYRSHILNVARDVTTFATSLPWKVNSDDMPIIIIRPPGGCTWDGSEFECSRMAVENALVWLIDNHPAYVNVALDIRQLDALGAPEDNTGRDMMDRFYSIEEEGDRNDCNSDAGSGEESCGRNYRAVRAPEADSSDDDVDDPVDAAGRGT